LGHGPVSRQHICFITYLLKMEACECTRQIRQVRSSNLQTAKQSLEFAAANLLGEFSAIAL